MGTTPNYGFITTPATDSTKRFIDWRVELAGDDPESTLMKIDSILASLDAKADELGGFYGVKIDENGDLILTYSSDTPPPLSINEDGDLVYALDSDNFINLGHVVGGGGGVSDYNGLSGKPQINGVVLSGSLDSSELGLASAPFVLTGFQPSQDETSLSLELQLTKEQYDKVIFCRDNAIPILAENMVVYPIGNDGEDSPAFSSIITNYGMYVHLYINYTTYHAVLSMEPVSVKPVYINIHELNTPTLIYNIYEHVTAYNQQAPIYTSISEWNITNIVLYPESKVGSNTYIFSNPEYRITIDTQSGMATLTKVEIDASEKEIIIEESFNQSKQYIDGIVGDISDMLDLINGEAI